MARKRVNETLSCFLVQPVCIIAMYVFVLACGYFRLSSLAFWLISAVLMTISYFWGKTVLCNINVKSDGSIYVCYPHDDILVNYEIENRKWIPLIWLDFILPRPNKNCILLPADMPNFEMKLNHLMWYGKIEFSVLYKANKRGVYKVNNVIIRSGDGFGLTKADGKIDVEQKSVIVIYPEIIQVKPEMLLSNPWSGSTGINGIIEDTSVLLSTREYEQADSWKRIDWRMAARSDDLQTKMFETYRHQGTHFILDSMSFVDEPEEKQERAISIMASLMVELEGVKISSGLSLPNTEESEAYTVLPGQGNTAEVLLSELAGFDESTAGSDFDIFSLNASDNLQMKVFLFCSSVDKITADSIIDRIPSNILTLVTLVDEGQYITRSGYELKKIRLDELYDNIIMD